MQSNTILAYLVLAWVVFITMRGELRIYLGFLIPTGPAPGPQPQTVPATSTADKTGTEKAADVAMKVLPFLL